MGQYLTPAEVRERFAKPLADLASSLADACKRWEKAYESGEIAREDILLNDVLAEQAIATLRKFQREVSGKTEDAIAGVYRYRKVEAKRRPRHPQGKGR